MIGAAATGWLALLTAPGARIGPIPFFLFLAPTILFGFVAGGAWAGLVGLVRARFGGNEVLISLMSNYVAIFFLQYLVSGPLRAPGSLPETPLLPRATWLPFILPGTRAHAGILIAIVAAGLVWMLLEKMPLGYELIVTGFNQSAARYAGIDVGRRLVLAAFFAGGLGALAGLVEVLGSQHRLMDGISGGVGFVGIIVALLARLNPLAVIPTALLYGGMSVGADAMQRRVEHSFFDNVYPTESRGFFCAGVRCAALLQNQSLRFLASLAANSRGTGVQMKSDSLMGSAFVVTWLIRQFAACGAGSAGGSG